MRVFQAVSVPWTAFVGAFLYYTAITLVAIGVTDLPTLFAVAYAPPLLAYLAVLAWRAMRAVAAIRIDVGPLPYPSLQ